MLPTTSYRCNFIDLSHRGQTEALALRGRGNEVAAADDDEADAEKLPRHERGLFGGLPP